MSWLSRNQDPVILFRMPSATTFVALHVRYNAADLRHDVHVDTLDPIVIRRRFEPLRHIGMVITEIRPRYLPERQAAENGPFIPYLHNVDRLFLYNLTSSAFLGNGLLVDGIDRTYIRCLTMSGCFLVDHTERFITFLNPFGACRILFSIVFRSHSICHQFSLLRPMELR